MHKSKRSQEVILEWQLCLDEREWQTSRRAASPGLASAAKTLSRHRYTLYATLCTATLLCALYGGWWLWHTSHAGLAQIEQELTGAVDLELRNQRTFSAHAIPADQSTSIAHTPLTKSVEIMTLQSQYALVRVNSIPPHATEPHRQGHFYRRTSDAWLPVQPRNEIQWGKVHSLESSYFIWRFHLHDAKTVAAVAPQIDEAYATFAQDYGLPIAPATTPKLIIEVRVAQEPRFLAAPQSVYESIIVPSPIRYLAPQSISDEELLAQAVVLALLKHLGTRATLHHAMDQRWKPLLAGMQLWQLWQSDLPLSTWRTEVLTWIYQDLAKESPRGLDGQVQLPEHFEQLCAQHMLWMITPVELGIPLAFCDSPGWSRQYLAHTIFMDPPNRFDMLSIPLNSSWDSADGYRTNPPTKHPGEAGAVATLLEAVTQTYGREHLSRLLSESNRHDTMATLFVGAFNTTPATIETEWQAYIHDLVEADE